MPGGNGRGLEGFGPRTGRGFGYCSGYKQPGFITGKRGRKCYNRNQRRFGFRGESGELSNEGLKKKIENTEKYLNELKKMVENNTEREEK
ncbi:MAG: DUF5320 domain-containing protein [candidate division WOR-3 bacterium]